MRVAKFSGPTMDQDRPKQLLNVLEEHQVDEYADACPTVHSYAAHWYITPRGTGEIDFVFFV